jgi:hypothetical protein
MANNVADTWEKKALVAFYNQRSWEIDSRYANLEHAAGRAYAEEAGDATANDRFLREMYKIGVARAAAIGKRDAEIEKLRALLNRFSDELE